MIRWRSGLVRSVETSWPGVIELQVHLDGEGDVRALAYEQVVGRPQVGDRVLLNTTAVSMDLGTGGYAMVVALPERLPADPLPGPGHLVKARYTPLQTTVLGVDEQDAPSHEALRNADDLEGMPVVVADLHSAVPAVVAGVRAGAPEARAVYVMTDGGALPLWFSRSVAGLRDAGWLVSVVTVGQAFGGDAEAVKLHSGLLAARHLFSADVVVPELDGDFGEKVRTQLVGLSRHHLVTVPVDGLLEELRKSPVPLSTMGRGLDDDPVYFLAAAAAGRHAANLLRQDG